MQHTVDSLMALAYNYADEYADTYEAEHDSYGRRTAREALRTALTEALALTNADYRTMLDAPNETDPNEFEQYRKGHDALLIEKAKLENQNDDLRAMLSEASDEIEAWGAYASPYFQEKHKLTEVIAKFRQDIPLDTYQAPQAAQSKGLFIDLIAAQGPEFVAEMAKIGCVQHDCDECKSRAAQPVRGPLTSSRLSELALMASSQGLISGSTNWAAFMLHGIGGDK